MIQLLKYYDDDDDDIRKEGGGRGVFGIRDITKNQLTLGETPAGTLLTVPCPVCTCSSVVEIIGVLLDVADSV